jgi:hypothetical protein
MGDAALEDGVLGVGVVQMDGVPVGRDFGKSSISRSVTTFIRWRDMPISMSSMQIVPRGMLSSMGSESLPFMREG